MIKYNQDYKRNIPYTTDSMENYKPLLYVVCL